MYRLLEATAERIAIGFAILGGLVLTIIIALTCVSITGRAFVPLEIGIGPIRGIYDITEIGMAVAVFAFLPYCQFRQGHANVELLQAAFPDVLNRFLDLLFNIGMFGIAAFGSWRLYLGMLDKHSFGETTLIAQIPVWYGYAASLAGALGFVVVAAFCVLRSLMIVSGRSMKVPQDVQH